jgi:riboflavin synthase
MFSGIISQLGRVQRAAVEDGSLTAVVETNYLDLELGESVAVNGVCLTVTASNDKGAATFFISAETLARSNLKALREGSRVNLERALTLNTRLSGHLVQGHVDGEGVLSSVQQSDGAFLLEFRIPRDLARYCVEKGSIALNGISLTLNRVVDSAAETTIAITIIPHTWTHTNLGDLKVGDPVNVEVDVMAKYAERLWQPYLKT